MIRRVPGPLRDASFDEALAEMRLRALDLAAEEVPVAGLAGRRLAEDVVARVDHPGFTNSAMDGYALRSADRGPRRVVGESRAGTPFPGEVGAGEAVRVSTGAEMPPGADAVLRLEDAEEADGRMHPRSDPGAGDHVRGRGEDVRRGQVLLARGAVVAPHEVGVAVAGGAARVRCARAPRVAVLASGDELMPAGAELAPGQVHDSNGPGVAAQARAAGAEVFLARPVADDARATADALRSALDGDDGPPPDLLVTIGGVSVGRHDHLREAFAELGVRELLSGVRIRPGHPLWLGARDGQRVLGLPGNPVSAAVCFHVFGRELLGLQEPWDRTARLAGALPGNPRRAELARCRRLPDGSLEPLPRQGSHAVTSLAGATHLALVPAGPSGAPAGARLRVCRMA